MSLIFDGRGLLPAHAEHSYYYQGKHDHELVTEIHVQVAWEVHVQGLKVILIAYI